MMPKIVGSPTTIADELERWVEEADVDGFNLSHITNPGSFEDIIEFVLPELRKRGLFRAEAPKGITAREQLLGQRKLLDDHYGSRFRWEAGKDKPKYLLKVDEDKKEKERPSKRRKTVSNGS
jgi:hypothetical protein